MRILIFGINYAPELAGIAPYTTGLAEHFASQGHEVEVITGIPHYPEWRPRRAKHGDTSNPAVRRFRHSVPRRPTAVGRALYELTWLFSALRSMHNARADVAIGIIPSVSGGILAYLAGRRLRIPFGLLFQDTMGAAAQQSGYKGAVRFASIARWIEAFIGRRAAAVAIVTEGFRAYLEGLGAEPDRIYRVRNWTRWTTSSEPRAECRRRLGWRYNEFICLHAGNMGKKQALDNLVETAQLLNGTSIRIVLAGGGNDRSRLLQLARVSEVRNMSFVDIQPPGQYEAMLEAADVLLINQRPSVVEMSLPSKIGSYMAAGRPIVAAVAEISDTAREIRHSGAGILVPAGDPRALADTLLRLETAPGERSGLAANGLSFMSTHLVPERVLGDYDRYLSVLMNAESKSPVPLGQATALSARDRQTHTKPRPPESSVQPESNAH